MLSKLAVSGFTVPDLWVQNAADAFPDEPAINPMSLEGVFSNAGTLFGMALGVILLPMLGGFHTDGEWWKRLLRFLVGVVGVLALYLGLKLIFPDGENWAAYIFRYIRYGLIGFWVAAVAPWVFVKLGLAVTHPKRSKKKVIKARRSYAR